MSPAQERHLKKYHSPRMETLVQIAREEAMLKQLQRENEARRRASLSWPRRVLSAIARGWGAV